jgi:prevent-host-death family protein
LDDTTTVTTKEARDQLSELVNRAAYGKERIVLTRRGKGVAALVPLDDLLALEKLMHRLEDQSDLEAAEKALDEARREGTVPWEKVKEDLGL